MEIVATDYKVHFNTCFFSDVNYFWSFYCIWHFLCQVWIWISKKLLYFAAALQSVFPQTELGTFMSLTKRDKERQLLELTMIVTGIRLFNKECGKGGEGIDDCE